MQSSRRALRRRITASIACLAFVLQALVPSLAHAAASAARGSFYPGELCSIDRDGARARIARAIDAEAPAPSHPSFAAAHCPFCALPPGAAAPGPIGFGWRVFDATTSAVPAVVSLDDRLSGSARGRPQTPRAPPRG